MRVAGSRDGITFSEPVRRETPVDDFDTGVRLFVEMARGIADGEKIEVVVGGIAGSFDAEKTALWKSPNIPGWEGKPLKKRLEEEFGVGVFLENDAALAALGEAVQGAGRGYPIVGYITVGTGVGGARIVDGKIDRTALGFEPGHQLVSCGGGSGTHASREADLESFISGAAFKRRYGKEPYEVTDTEAWEEAAHTLAVGLHNAAVFWSPDAVVLGGSMITGNPAIELERVREHLGKTLTIFKAPLVVLKAQLGDTGGLQGALALLKSSCL